MPATMTEQQQIQATIANLVAFGQRLRAAQPTMHELAQNLHKASQQIAAAAPSLTSALQGPNEAKKRS